MLVNCPFGLISGIGDDPASKIAAAEIVSLSRRRFGSGKGELPVRFVSEKTLPSFEVRFRNGVLEFAAPDGVETLYGVYDFCEKFLGFFFWAPGEDLLNGAGPVEIPEGILIPAKAPLLSIRGFVQEFPFDGDSPLLADWMAKNKLNYLNVWMKYYDKLDQPGRRAFLDRGIEVQSGHHNFDYWIPAKKYHAAHPEFFAEIGGVRIQPSADKNALLLSEQLCTTNKELRAEIVERMIEYCDENPEIRTVALIPNDGFGWCECEECSKFYDKEKKGELYSLSSHVYLADRIYHDMLADVAAQLKKKRPGLLLNFCAYVNYCRPSDGFKLDSNLTVGMAPYWRCINHRIDDPSCPVNTHYASDIAAWVKAKEGGKVIVYEYFMGVNFYLSLPMIHHHDVFKEVKFYHELGVDGLMTQFHLPHWSVYGINFRAMADAMRGEEEAVAVPRMLKALFGSDADEAETLYLEMRKVLESAGACHIPYPYSLFSRTRLEQYEALLRLAGALAAKAPENRLRRDMVVWCEYLVRFKRLFDGYHAGRIGVGDVEEFREWIHSHRDSHVFVHAKFDIYLAAWCDAIRSGREWLHFNIDWEDEYIRIHRKTLNGSAAVER